MQRLNPYLSPILDEIDRLLNDAALTNEHQIIKHLQDKKIVPFDNFSLADPKGLFSAHFLCMHALYHLKKFYRDNRSFTLDIQFVRIQRIPVDETSLLNNEDSTALETNDPLESYYLTSEA
ncbi:DNA-J related domain-containing protein [Pseudocolwellia sp. HL-MZ19]|uniref:DNA-J related domain-containing protein n=1 Tax=Pseudocolwellia sp. HL-MZ19 TaxID=3400846 RepID=UPI003CEF495A